jgi:hypothetical protein
MAGLFNIEEMRAHCKHQIERYQKVLQIINTHPEVFPPAPSAKS